MSVAEPGRAASPAPSTAVRFLRPIRPVRSLAVAVDFYCQALGFVLDEGRAGGAVVEPTGPRPRGLEGGGSVMLRLGAQQLELVQTEANAATGPVDEGSTDVRFQHIALVTLDLPAAVARLRARAPAVVCITQGGPQALEGAAAGISAFKFRDPDGHAVEWLSFAPAVLPPAWRGAVADEAGAVGLDHAALSVHDTARSIAFYRDVLALRVSGRQVNEGGPQARLDGLAGLASVRVEVVSLSPARATPHLELLGYHPPSGSAPVPPCRARSPRADILVLALDGPTLRRVHERMGSARAPSDPLDLDDPDGHRWWLLPG